MPSARNEPLPDEREIARERKRLADLERSNGAALQAGRGCGAAPPLE